MSFKRSYRSSTDQAFESAPLFEYQTSTSIGVSFQATRFKRVCHPPIYYASRVRIYPFRRANRRLPASKDLCTDLKQDYCRTTKRRQSSRSLVPRAIDFSSPDRTCTFISPALRLRPHRPFVLVLSDEKAIGVSKCDDARHRSFSLAGILPPPPPSPTVTV